MASFIPQDPQRQKSLVALLGAVAAIGLFWNFWATPRAEEIVLETERVEALEGQNRNARVAALRGLEGLEENLATFERHVRRLEQLVPSASQVPSLIVDMNTEAERLGIEPLSFTPNPEEPGVAYNRRTFDVAWVGEYHAMGQFLAAIASLSRIVTPIGLQLELFDRPDDYPRFASPVLATFTIETWVIPPGGTLQTQMNVDEGTGAEEDIP
ncbi:MAG: type 4a pilus biogenesis protein PilO [Longimicrobiales bacterium]|nr:type 4a pilus biogenesis protein PilO [Longimicrobiales bacterium]